MILLAAYPDHSLESRLERSAYGDDISQAYFAAWLRAKPDDHHLRLVLVQRQMSEGELAPAEKNLSAILSSDRVKDADLRQARQLMLTLKLQALWRLPRDNPGYTVARTAYLEQLQLAANGETNPARLDDYAAQALAAADRRLATTLYLRSAAGNLPHPQHWYDHVAGLCLADGRYKTAANLYFRAMPAAGSLALQRYYFLAGLRTLRSGNLLKESLAASSTYLGPLANDPTTLYYLVQLAQTSNRLDLAGRYVSRLLKPWHGNKGKSV